jgi:1-acyl-sn-glycerol-3-phosphate acyltransferase
MPAAAIRRPLTIIAWIGMSILSLVLSPLLLALAAIATLLARRPQPLILARLLIGYFARELAVLIACGALWLASGAGLRLRSERFQLLHYRLLRWFVGGLALQLRSLLDIDVVPTYAADALQALKSDRPLLVFSRHAGPGDTVLLVDLLLGELDRLPSVVFRNSLTIDPCVDLISHRLPHAVLDPTDRRECEAQIERVTAALGRRGVLLLFPEGGNFTPERRRRAIRTLWGKRRRREATKAEQMSHVLPPRPSGALAAFRANPSADVIFSAHTGLGLAAFPRELWRHTPIGGTFNTHLWLAPAAERPAGREEQIAWLYDWWGRLDRWIEAQGDEAASNVGAHTSGPGRPS